MTEGTEALAARPASAPRTRSSNRLGRLLRNVALSPGAGFEAAAGQAERRANERLRPPEGAAPYVIGAIGGAALVLVWLKLGALVDVREVAPGDFRWGYLFGSLVAGALLAVIVLLVWRAVGSGPIRRLGGRASSRDLVVTAGLADVPLLLVVALVLPLDLLIVGKATFTSERLTELGPMMWSAFSTALSVAAAVWSVVLLGRGLEKLTGLTRWRPWAAAGAFLLCLAGVAAVPAGMAFLNKGGTVGVAVCGGIFVAAAAVFGWTLARRPAS